MARRKTSRLIGRVSAGLVSFNLFYYGFSYYCNRPLTLRGDERPPKHAPGERRKQLVDPLARFRDPCSANPSTTPDDLLISDNRARLPTGVQGPYKLLQSPGKGMGLFATEFIPKGSTILKEKPVLTCPSVSAEAAEFQRAEALRTMVDQFFHLSPPLQRGVSELKGEMVVVPRFLMRSFSEILDDYTHPDGSRLSWRERMRLQQVVRVFYTNAGVIYNRHPAWWCRWLWRPVGVGDGLYLTFSRMNHSCEPNAAWATNCPGSPPGVMSVWAQRDIQPEEEIAISYIAKRELAEPVDRRRQRLRGWGFNCECSKCGSVTGLK